MEFICLDGSLVKSSLAKYSLNGRKSSRSVLQESCKDVLREIFTNAIIIEEFNIPKTQLFIDFFIPHYSLAIEVQGKQHNQYVKFFHKDKDGFNKQLQRDSQKRLWCELNDIKLLEIHKSISRDDFIEKINECF